MVPRGTLFSGPRTPGDLEGSRRVTGRSLVHGLRDRKTWVSHTEMGGRGKLPDPFSVGCRIRNLRSLTSPPRQGTPRPWCTVS